MAGKAKAAGSRGSSTYGRSSRPKRQMYRRILVASEGEITEKQYVQRLSQVLRSKGVNVSVTAVHGSSDPVSVVQKCIDERDLEKESKREPFDHCVCLVDVDTHAHLDDAITLARAHGIQLIVTNLKFEAWLLWHVSDSLGAKTSSELDALMRKHALFQKEKHLAQEFPFDGVDRAVTNAYSADPDLAANRRGPDPSSAMPVLIQLMRGIL
ncbi:RloB family protein [Curtobacterium sp. GD1]|uniref:RloB family protein n=1 Tax=Curtobacterium sp. GD1 TaxID=2810612 RepID=UPI001E356EE4|nr:RloB family protein [Curtobacterium sp. GD1]MCC8908867.1 RloB domain-containing protein [Curtobacterium sp. GD1]